MAVGSSAFAALDEAGAHHFPFDWTLVDVETSGLDPGKDRVLSLAVVTLKPDGKQDTVFSTLLNPGCDPGPVQIHRLTAETLRGAPVFEDVARGVAALLQDRVMVAHNAHFDYSFLLHEFTRVGLTLPVSRRLCTIALNRQIDPPTKDLNLTTLAAHYGVPLRQTHDALEDALVLAEVFRGTLREAAKLGLPLPLISCPPKQHSQYSLKPPKVPCAFHNPGRLEPGGPLVQGMKIAITGETATPRAELIARSVTAGLNVVASVSRHTSALVSNDPVSRTAKAMRALAEGVPVVAEHAFLTLLSKVQRGAPYERTGPTDAVAPPKANMSTAPRAGPLTPGGPLALRRVLVIGGPHSTASAARARVVALGGSTAVNLSRSVTDVVVLHGGHDDRRMPRIRELGVPVHDESWLIASVGAPADAIIRGPWTEARPRIPQVLPRGGVVDLPMQTPGSPANEWQVRAAWAPLELGEIDVVAFILDEDEQVIADEDFVFYGAPKHPAGTVRLLADGPAEQTIAAHLASLPLAARKILVAAVIDGNATFGDVGAVQVEIIPGNNAAPLARATLDAATTERTLVLAEIYRRATAWRIRAVGQGFDHGLDVLATSFGVNVNGSADDC
ncbi:TerD family protein [Streptomyces sp. NPDC048419]|uniref:TerD family protein n=1 Tax=Streptomyces sp. NPDC048419 TaxID=3365547 RepID=UPI0037168E2A